MKRNIEIISIDEVAGRVLLGAKDVADNTTVGLFLAGQSAAWGTAKVQDGIALVVGRSSLASTYSLRVVAYSLRPKVAPRPEPEPDESAGKVDEKAS